MSTYIYDPDAAPCEVSHVSVGRVARKHGQDQGECPYCGIPVGVPCKPGEEAEETEVVAIEIRATEIDMDGMSVVDWSVGEMYGWGAYTLDIDKPRSQERDGWSEYDWQAGWLASGMSSHEAEASLYAGGGPKIPILPVRCSSTHSPSNLPLSYGPVQCDLNEGHQHEHRTLEYDTWWSSPVSSAHVIDGRTAGRRDSSYAVHSMHSSLRSCISDIESSVAEARRLADLIISCK